MLNNVNQFSNNIMVTLQTIRYLRNIFIYHKQGIFIYYKRGIFIDHKQGIFVYHKKGTKLPYYLIY